MFSAVFQWLSETRLAMPENGVNQEFIDCIFIEHKWLEDVLRHNLDDEEYEQVKQLLEDAELSDVGDMVVSSPHFPCIKVNNGHLPANYTYVADAFYKLHLDRGSSAQRLLQVINYFHAIGKDGILDLQVAY